MTFSKSALTRRRKVRTVKILTILALVGANIDDHMLDSVIGRLTHVGMRNECPPDTSIRARLPDDSGSGNGQASLHGGAK